MKRYAYAVITLGIATAASAQVTSIESSNPAPKKVVGDLDKIICERVERTGSRLAIEKICMTALQWKEHQQGHREDFERVQRIVNQEPQH